jgi:hypothetical protein
MAMGVLPLLAVAAIRFSDAKRRVQVMGPLVSAVAVSVVALSTYAHMLVLGAPLFVLPVVLDRRPGERPLVRVRRGLRITVLTVVSISAAYIIVPVWFGHTLDLIRRNSDITAGWPLPGFSPDEVLGFMRTVTPKPSSARVVWSLVSVAVIALSALFVRTSHRRLVRYFAIFVGLVALSYVAVYWREGGPSYRQWKWITFFEPAVVVLALTVVVVALEGLIALRTSRTKGIAVTAALGFAVVASANSASRTGNGPGVLRDWLFVSPAHYGLSTDPLLKTIPAVNINMSTAWENMWAVYFMPNKTLYMRGLSYYPISNPLAEWTLVGRVGTMEGPAVYDVNSRFRLLREDPAGPLSVDSNALGGTISVSLNQRSLASGQISGTVAATNNGRARWLPLTSQVGGVQVGVHLADASSHVVANDWARVPLISDRYFNLPPDSTTIQPFSLPRLSPGHYELTFELASEQVAWFGPTVTEEVDVP